MNLLDTYKNYNDKELISLIVDNGNEEAISYLLYNKCWNQLKYYTNYYYGNDELLHDLISELFINLQKNNWKSVRDFKGESSLKSYICRIGRNLILEKRKNLIGFSEKTINIDVTPIEQPENVNSVEKRMQLLEIYDAINRLKPESYKIVMSLYLEGYSDEEIATELTKRKIIHKQEKKDGNKIENRDEKISKDYVYTLRSRAIKEIKNLLGN